MSELNEQLRAEFEAVMLASGYTQDDLKRPYGEYFWQRTADRWEGFQAARSTPAPQAAPSDIQQHRTGYGEGVRAAAKLCDAKYQARVESGHPREASTARALAEEIRSLQSTAPAVTQAAPSEPVAPWHEFRVEPTGDAQYDASNFLLNAAQEFWNSCRKAGQLGAVQWLTGSNGELLIYTRGEYRERLMSNIDKLSQQEPKHFSAPLAAQQSPADARDAALEECKRFLEDMHCMPVDWTIAESQVLHQRVCAAIAAATTSTEGR